MYDLDPNFLLPLWRAVIAHFQRFRPLVQAEQQLYAPRSRGARP